MKYCAQCTVDAGYSRSNDFKGRVTPSASRRGFRAFVACDGCGALCSVDYEGVCVSRQCDKRHGLAIVGKDATK